MPDSSLAGKRVLVVGAETDVGRAVSSAVAEAGAYVALIAATNDVEAAFVVQRLARRLASPDKRVISQAIDATNEMAVRVMVRQVAKDLGGLDAVVFAADFGKPTAAVMDLAILHSNREFARTGGGTFIAVVSRETESSLHEVPPGNTTLTVRRAEDAAEVAAQVIAALADAPHTR